MLGLIKKDLLMLKSNIKTIIIMLLVFSLMSINGENSFLTFFPVFISIILMMTTFSYDEYNKTDAYIISLPNGKNNAVKAKYIVTFCLTIITLTISFLLSCLVSIKNLDLEEIVMTTLGCGTSILILQSILYPIIYKLGIEKGRISIFLLVFGMTGLGTILMKNGLSIKVPTSVINLLDNYCLIIVPLIALIILFISYKISVRIYSKKEF